MQRRPHTPRQPRAVSGASGYSVWRTAASSGGASSSRMLASCRVGRPRTLLHCEEGRREIRSGSILLNEEILLALQFFWGKNIIIIIAAEKVSDAPQPPVVHRAPSDFGGRNREALYRDVIMDGGRGTPATWARRGSTSCIASAPADSRQEPFLATFQEGAGNPRGPKRRLIGKPKREGQSLHPSAHEVLVKSNSKIRRVERAKDNGWLPGLWVVEGPSA